jgi:serine/threonine-protein kinase
MRLGPYEILVPVGSGGMGQVWRARDTRLGRDVAVKVLPAEFATDPDRLRRFEQEARAAAALNHPNILVLHDVGRHEGQPYLVTELLEGETLREQIGRGGLAVSRAVDLGIQIARGLAAAHEQRIVHRDLKPGNVFVTKDGTVKILDFGLAKLTQPVSGTEGTGGAAASGTDTASGLAVGTVGYMAPEQIRLQVVDHRADIFAFGCVLYELLSGRRAFQGDTPADTMSAILTKDPEPLAGVIERLPAALDRIVRRCLAKVPDDRFSSAHDVGLALEVLAADEPRPIGPTSISRWRAGGRRMVAVVALTAGALLGGVVLANVFSWIAVGQTDRAAPQVVRSLLGVAPADELNAGGWPGSWIPTAGGSRTALAWTPDGRALVFVGRRGGEQQLYVRALEEAEARPLPGTDGAQMPAVSADGRWVAFWAAGAIRKVPLAGGPPSVLVPDVVAPPAGMAWNTDGPLLFAGFDANRATTVQKAGDGKSTPVTTLGPGEMAHVLPQWLPGGTTILFTVRKRFFGWGGDDVVVQDVATGARKALLREAVDARYEDGYLIFMRTGTLFAAPFDPATLEVRGEPAALIAGVAQALLSATSGNIIGAGQFVVAPSGSLAYISGSVGSYPDARLVSVDRAGRVKPLSAPPRAYRHVRVSPQGDRLAVTVASLAGHSVWVFDIGRGVLTKLPGQGDVAWTGWTADGNRILLDEFENGTRRLSWQQADGTTLPVRLAERLTPASCSPDGREIVGVKDEDLWTLVVQDPAGAPRPLVQTPAAERAPALSPDGRWLAFESNASGRFEVYLQPYPGPGTRVQVSLDGGSNPAWHPSGRELFFLTSTDDPGPSQLNVVTITPGTFLKVGQPRKLFEFGPDLDVKAFPLRGYDVSADGESFFTRQETVGTAAPPVTHVHLVLNWLDEVKARLAGSGPSANGQ